MSNILAVAMSDQATPSQSESSDDDDAYHDCRSEDSTEVDTEEHIFEMSAGPEHLGGDEEEDTCSEEEQDDQLTELQSGIVLLSWLSVYWARGRGIYNVVLCVNVGWEGIELQSSILWWFWVGLTSEIAV